MKSLPLTTSFAATMLACAIPLTPPAQAGTGIQRCQAADGTTVYTDKACSAFGAKSVAISGDLLTRIAYDDANRESLGYADAQAPTTLVAPGRRSPTAGCARSATQLEMDLRGAFALGDVNRVAESFHWVGMSQKQSKPVMQRLERLTRQRLADSHYFDAQIGGAGLQFADAGDPAATGNGAAGVMQLLFSGEGREAVDLDVQRYAGCYFVHF